MRGRGGELGEKCGKGWGIIPGRGGARERVNGGAWKSFHLNVDRSFSDLRAANKASFVRGGPA